ncbi:MAG: hypothetical protein PWP39_1679 [Pyrococcus sp.]|nr:hypothetical protein [Pyrococcus sp.]
MGQHKSIERLEELLKVIGLKKNEIRIYKLLLEKRYC